MDKVRLGRALGYGARHAAKTMKQVVDAATTPDSKSQQSQQPQSARPQPTATQQPPTFVEHLNHARQTVTHANQEVRRARRSIFAPFKEYSRTVGLQVIGVFFGVIAGTMAKGMWIRRQGLHLPLTSPEAQKFYLHAFFFVLFAYFAITSFVRAVRPSPSAPK